MEQISAYRGIAGETTRLFARVVTIATVIPALVVMVLMTLFVVFVAGKLGLPPEFNLLIGFLAVSPVIGSAAIGARGGDIESGISYLAKVPSEVVNLALRSGALLLAAGIPSTLLAKLLLPHVAGFNVFAVTGFNSTLVILGTIILFLVALIFPVFSLIVSLASETVAETFTRERWIWLLSERGKDIKPFFAAYLGGIAMFYIVALPSILILIALAFLFNDALGFLVASTGFLLPLGAAPVLLGRLAGAFVAAESDVFASVSYEETAAKTQKIVEDEVRLKNAIQRIKSMARTDINAAIKNADALLTDYADNPALLTELCAMHIKKGDDGKSLESAARAITEAIRAGDRHSASITFASLGKIRRQLRLGADEFERLALTLITKKNFNDAVWCFQGCAAMGGKEIIVHKGIIATAEAAKRAGDKNLSLKIFEFFSDKYPDSQFAEYSKSEIQKIKQAPL